MYLFTTYYSIFFSFFKISIFRFFVSLMAKDFFFFIGQEVFARRSFQIHILTLDLFKMDLLGSFPINLACLPLNLLVFREHDDLKLF